MIAPGIGATPRRVLARATVTPDAGVVALASVAAAWAVIIVAALPQEIVQDSWLALVSGREVAQHGLPHTDSLTAWTAGTRWIDQQWLGQLFYYRLSLLGGISAVMLMHALILVATVVVGLWAARRLGASTPSVILGGLAALTVAPWGMQMRTQDVGELFFVTLVALLADDARKPSRRVYLALPLLVVWANVHGSVVLGAALVALRALFLFRSRVRATLLLAGAVLATFASPYGLSLVGYYRHLLGDPLLHWFIDEWGPSTPSLRTAAFYALAFATVWLTARHGSRVTLFSRVCLLLTLVAATMSVRNIVWFGLTALVLFPQLLDPSLSGLDFSRLRRFVGPLALATAAVAVATVAFAVTRPTAWLLREWPATAQATRIATLAGTTSTGRVFADDRYADWLLWNEPQLRGRVAYDVRFELFTHRQIRLLADYFNRIGDNWRAALNGYQLVAFDPSLQQPLERGLLAQGRFRTVGRNPQIVVLDAAGRAQPPERFDAVIAARRSRLAAGQSFFMS